MTEEVVEQKEPTKSLEPLDGQKMTPHTPKDIWTLEYMPPKGGKDSLVLKTWIRKEDNTFEEKGISEGRAVRFTSPLMSHQLGEFARNENYHPSVMKFLPGVILDLFSQATQQSDQGPLMIFIKETPEEVNLKRYGNTLDATIMAILTAVGLPFFFTAKDPKEAAEDFYRDPEFEADESKDGSDAENILN